MEPVCSPITHPSSPMQLIAGLYKGLFISQRATKGALSKSSSGLLNHRSGQDQQRIIWMCQNNIHHPFLKHVCSTQASSHRGVQGGGRCVSCTRQCCSRTVPWDGGRSAAPLPGQDISKLEQLATTYFPTKRWRGLSKVSGNPLCTQKKSHKHRWAGGAHVLSQLSN